MAKRRSPIQDEPTADEADEADEAVAAPYGFDVVGEDGRRIVRSMPEADARNEAARISSATGEVLTVVPAQIGSPAVAFATGEPEPEAETEDDPDEEPDGDPVEEPDEEPAV